MKSTLTAPGLIVVLSLVLVARSATSEDARSELARLKGTWVRVLDGKTYVVNFNGETFAEIFEFADGTSTTSGTITLDPTTRPHQMDWKFAAGTGRGEKLKGTTAHTIYELDGDTFKFCARKKVRPQDFPDKEGVFPDKEGADGYIYLVFRRAK
jgi:uncharacterized protein (TIGR03067 family)